MSSISQQGHIRRQKPLQVEVPAIQGMSLLKFIAIFISLEVIPQMPEKVLPRIRPRMKPFLVAIRRQVRLSIQSPSLHRSSKFRNSSYKVCPSNMGMLSRVGLATLCLMAHRSTDCMEEY